MAAAAREPATALARLPILTRDDRAALERWNRTDSDYPRDARIEALVAAPHKTFRDYKTYKKTFETLRPFFFVLQKFDLISRSFYVKYTSKSEI